MEISVFMVFAQSHRMHHNLHHDSRLMLLSLAVLNNVTDTVLKFIRVTQIRKSVKLRAECFDSHYIGPEDSKNTKIMIESARFQLPLAPFSCMLCIGGHHLPAQGGVLQNF